MGTTDPIMGVGFANPRFPSLGVEAMTLSDLLRRVPPDHFCRPQRPAFHLLFLFTAGCGEHRLDFRLLRCARGTALHVRPGQVQQFDLAASGLEAEAILFRPDFVLPEAVGPEVTVMEQALPSGAADLAGAELDGVADGFASLAREYARSEGSRLDVAILQHLLQVVLLRLAAASGGGRGEDEPGGPAYATLCRRFLRALERGFIETRQVADYARVLGASEKTLGRACLAVTGLPPARLVERRVLLEAKRLLVHTALPSASIAAHLGFDEPTNFAKFFRRLEGTTPGRFRAIHLDGGG